MDIRAGCQVCLMGWDTGLEYYGPFFIVYCIGTASDQDCCGKRGLCRRHSFLYSEQERESVCGNYLFGFQNGNYGNIALTIFLKDLYTALWTLLLVVPGIIKHYEYRMIPYILAENPTMPREEAFQISRRMMMGQKMDVFVLDLSFIGWFILEKISFGLAGLFFVRPYYETVFAELYEANKQKAYREGYIR